MVAAILWLEMMVPHKRSTKSRRFPLWLNKTRQSKSMRLSIQLDKGHKLKFRISAGSVARSKPIEPARRGFHRSFGGEVDLARLTSMGYISATITSRFRLPRIH